MWNWVSTGFKERLCQGLKSTSDSNGVDQTLLGLPLTSSAHGSWNPLLTQSEPPVPTQAMPCLFLSISHLRALDLYCSYVSSLVCSPVSCWFWWNPPDGAVDAPVSSACCCLAVLRCCRTLSWSVGALSGLGHPLALASLFLRILSFLLHDNPRQDNFIFFLS